MCIHAVFFFISQLLHHHFYKTSERVPSCLCTKSELANFCFLYFCLFIFKAFCGYLFLKTNVLFYAENSVSDTYDFLYCHIVYKAYFKAYHRLSASMACSFLFYLFIYFQIITFQNWSLQSRPIDKF